MIKNLELKVINGEKVSAACTGQLGQAACATCIAAPDCPILRLKKAQDEQIPAPNRKSYLDDLISDDSASLKSLTQEDIETERNNANRVRNIATSESALKQAEALGIEPNTDDYNIFIALKDHYDKLVEEADKNSATANNRL